MWTTGAARRIILVRRSHRIQHIWSFTLRNALGTFQVGDEGLRYLVRPIPTPRLRYQKRFLNSDVKKKEEEESPSVKVESSTEKLPITQRAYKFVKYQWIHFKETLHQYWIGTKLLWLEVQTSTGIARRLLTGRTLTRRERKQLTRTTADLFRVVPFAVFVIVPFLEFLLPVALYFFPSMLPSTFQDSTKKEEKERATLRARIALTGFLGDALAEIEEKGAIPPHSEQNSEQNKASAAELSEFIAKARKGEIDTQDVTKFARAFRDELTLDNLKRAQLAVLCRYMGLRPFGPDDLLRFQLRTAIRALRDDDQRIVYEGLDSLTRQEMQEACAERGMRAVGLTKQQYRAQLEQWLELAANRQVPIALLIMSRAFTLNQNFESSTDTTHVGTSDNTDRALAESISSLDADIVNQAVIEAGSERETPEMRQRRLEMLIHQNKLIAEERAAAEQRLAEEEALRKAAEEEAAAAAAPESSFYEDSQTSLSEQDKELSVTSSSTTVETDTNKEPVDEAPPKNDFLHEPLDTLKRKLEVAEFLEMMSHLSALEREKHQLEAIKAKLREGDKEPETAVVEATGDSEHPLKGVVKHDGKLQALKRKLTRMTSSLESEIEKVDSSLGDKLHIIDQDNDGVIDADELRDAVTRIVRGKTKDHIYDDAELEAFVETIMREIDTNEDDVISVEEVERWHDKLVARRDFDGSES
mmetsp:Transcript_4731/g.6704  ORF Transcript_4731/g.6704 Transcript_4731/m.6704 type:complete len:700 (-) Transcript_4731:1573-3672(-)